MSVRKKLLIACIMITIVIAGLHIEQTYAMKDKVSQIMLEDTIDYDNEKNSITNQIEPGIDWAVECIAKDKSICNPEIIGDNSPKKVGVPYKVYYVDMNSITDGRGNLQDALLNYFWEYPLMNNNGEIITTCTIGKYNGKWEPCLLNSGLSEDMIRMSSNFDSISDVILKNDIKDPLEIQHIRFIIPFQFDAFYVRTASNQEFIIPISLRPGFMKMDNLKAYELSDVMNKLTEQLDALKYTLPFDDKSSGKPMIP